MESNQYVDTFKKMIAARAKEFSQSKSLDAEFFKNLFFEIKDDFKKAAVIFGYPPVDEPTLKDYYEVARKEYLSVNPIKIEPASSLTRKGFETWLTSKRKNEIKWNYVDRYLRYLDKLGRPKSVIDETKQSSLDIISKLGDPESSEAFYVKGLVVGAVQSGKTENFNAVINRAIDCGYVLIIVLSGIMEDLRNQTQKRIENDVIGEGKDTDSQRSGAKGVGNIERFGTRVGSEVEQVFSITSPQSDFDQSLVNADFSLNHTNVLVCKKNVSILRNLIIWLHDCLEQDQDQHNIPLLIIDDEADNASLNNEGAKGREYASKINGQIRTLLRLFHKKTYLGYTATPFANVLQDRNDTPEQEWPIPYKIKGETKEKHLPQEANIFPDDFIVLLKPSDNYIGAKQLFETIEAIDNDASEKLPLVHAVNDHIENFPARVDPRTLVGVKNFASKDEWNEEVGEFGTYLDFTSYKEYRQLTRSSEKTDNFPGEIPSSLKQAILCFLLSIAVRESRKPSMMKSSLYQPHHTMLIHVSRFTSWQNTTRNLVRSYVNELTTLINNDKPESVNSIYFEFKNIWYNYYATIIESIKTYLPHGYVDEFMAPIVFDSLKNHLPEAIKGIEVKAINSEAREELEYPKTRPQKIIAIGGNRLSRGFTLEGLTVNYFVRTTNYSDTLLQMGRWFGYRPGYLDCCKLFTTQDSIDKFNATTRCIEELEMAFKDMEEKKKTPRNFILRVRKHPGVLKITRPSILKNTTEVQWSYQDQLEMTTEFDVSKEKIERVWDVFKSDIAPLFKSENGKKNGCLISPQMSGEEIIELLKKENNFAVEKLSSMIKFIELCQEKKKLTKWTVAIKTTGQARKLCQSESNLPETITLAMRQGPSEKQVILRQSFLNNKKFKATGKSANIVSSGKDLSLLLSDQEIKEAETGFIDNRIAYYLKKNPELSKSQAKEKALQVTFPERVYREKMKDDEALLIIYLFDSSYSFNQQRNPADEEFKQLVEKYKYNLDIPIIGYALGFPPIEDDPGGVYVKGKYTLDEDINEDEYQDVEDLAIPSDVVE